MNGGSKIRAGARRGSTGARRAWRRAIGIALAYALIGALWVPSSDWALRLWVDDAELLALLQTWKGWFFTVISSLVLFLVLMRMFRKDALRELASIRQQNDLRALSRFQDGVIDNASIWITVIDAEARITVWNKAAEQISGYAREDVLGRTDIWTLLYPDAVYRNSIADKVRAILEQGEEVAGFQTIIRCRDGQQRTMAWNSRRFVSEGGEVGSIAIGQDVTEREQMQEELEWIAAHDPLTGLLNRHGFTVAVESAMRRDAGEPLQRGALLIADADNFKHINDRFGHVIGDSALQLLADTMLRILRPEDRLGRIGGEEFAIYLPGLSWLAAETVAERIRHAVATAEFTPEGTRHTLSISIGGAAFEHPTSFAELFRQADTQLYRAKAEGRNRVAFTTVAPRLGLPAAA